MENFCFPFFVCVVEKLLELDGIIKFEDARKIPGLLVELKVFTEGTIYCSHKWRELHHPDDRDKTKFQQMKKLLKRPALKDARFVWMDFLCVPQEDDETKKMAIRSFASYVRCCEYFIILVGTDGNSTLSEYNTRGWCRLERIAAMSPANKRGIKMFVHNASDNSFQQAFIVDGAIPNIATELSPMGGAFTGNSNAEMSQIEPALSMLCDEIISSPPDDFMEKTAELIRDQINLFKINQEIERKEKELQQTVERLEKELEQAKLQKSLIEMYKNTTPVGIVLPRGDSSEVKKTAERGMNLLQRLATVQNDYPKTKKGIILLQANERQRQTAALFQKNNPIVSQHQVGRAVAARGGQWGVQSTMLLSNTLVSELQWFHKSLQGPIPKALGRLSGLTHLILNNNNLTGQIPPELGKLTNLTQLYLCSNQLTGTLPAGLANVRYLNIAGNAGLSR